MGPPALFSRLYLFFFSRFPPSLPPPLCFSYAGYKKDLSRAYRQLRIDPRDAHLWGGESRRLSDASRLSKMKYFGHFPKLK